MIVFFPLMEDEGVYEMKAVLFDGLDYSSEDFILTITIP